MSIKQHIRSQDHSQLFQIQTGSRVVRPHRSAFDTTFIVSWVSWLCLKTRSNME